MVSLRAGHVYVIYTTLTRPDPKEKIAVCVSVGDGYFIWFNTKPRLHGDGQLLCDEGDHSALYHECYLDLSSLKVHTENEIATAQERGPLSQTLRDRVLVALDQVQSLPPRHARIIREALLSL